MMHDNCIRAESIEEMVEITAGLVRHEIFFKSFKDNGYWMIELTGGY